jgi:hypothetical protein
MSTQIVMASTLFAGACAAAAADAGLLGAPDRRILLVVNSAPKPELTPALDEIVGAGPVLARFDRVEHLTDLVEPVHPHAWSLRAVDIPLLERLLRATWEIGDDQVELVLESIALPPASTLARIFDAAPVTVLSDGLMTYGPTRTPVPWRTARRLRALVHLDLVPGLRPVLLSEHRVAATTIPFDAARKIFAEISEATGAGDADSSDEPGERRAVAPATTAVVVGQYLSALDLMTRAEEGALYADMVAAAADAGMHRVVFKPHPSSPPGYVARMRQVAADRGIALEVLRDERPVEVLFVEQRPALVLGCFSTALLTAREMFGISVASTGTREVLQRLTPWANSNRIPVTIVDALTRADAPCGDVGQVQALVDSVAYTMQPETVAHLAATVKATMADMPRAEMVRYHRRWRVLELGLAWQYAPGQAPGERRARPRPSTLRRARRRLARLRRAALRRLRPDVSPPGSP